MAILRLRHTPASRHRPSWSVDPARGVTLVTLWLLLALWVLG